MYRKYKARVEQKKKERGNRYSYNVFQAELIDCSIRRDLYFKRRSLQKIPPTEKQLELLEKLQLKCIFYGIPCRLEFQSARKNKFAALSTICKMKKRLREVENGNI